MNLQPHPVDLHVGARLRSIRNDRKMSQAVLGKKIGLTFQQIQKYERGYNRVSASKLFEAGEALGVDIGAFFEGLRANGAADTKAPVAVTPEIAEVVDAMVHLNRDEQAKIARMVGVFLT